MTRHKDKSTRKPVKYGGKPWTAEEEVYMKKHIAQARAAGRFGYGQQKEIWDEIALTLGRSQRAIASKYADLRRQGLA